MVQFRNLLLTVLELTKFGKTVFTCFSFIFVTKFERFVACIFFFVPFMIFGRCEIYCIVYVEFSQCSRVKTEDNFDLVE